MAIQSRGSGHPHYPTSRPGPLVRPGWARGAGACRPACGKCQTGAMDERVFDRSGQQASVIGLGTWQLGADWGEVSEKDALAVLETAAESGVTFFDTADVYGDGRSEEIIATFLRG